MFLRLYLLSLSHCKDTADFRFDLYIDYGLFYLYYRPWKIGLTINIKIVDNIYWRTTYMNSDYKVGDLIYDANIYDAMNTNLDDWYFYKRWLPENKDARILELCCGTGRLTLLIAKEGYDITGIDIPLQCLPRQKLKLPKQD